MHTDVFNVTSPLPQYNSRESTKFEIGMKDGVTTVPRGSTTPQGIAEFQEFLSVVNKDSANEVTVYCNEPLLDPSEDILGYWRRNSL